MLFRKGRPQYLKCFHKEKKHYLLIPYEIFRKDKIFEM